MSLDGKKGLSRDAVAFRVAQDIQSGWYVNLGIGTPEKVANFIPADKEIILHSENGILGMGAGVPIDQADADLINAGKRPISLTAGGCFFDHVDSFSMMRGGHLDLCLLGAFQVSMTGDLANWWTGDEAELPAVGGAMDLVAGAKRVFVIMDHVTKSGEPKIVKACSYPLTGLRSVSRIYTDLAIINVTPSGLLVEEIAQGVSYSELQSLTEAPLLKSPSLRVMTNEPLEKRG